MSSGSFFKDSTINQGGLFEVGSLPSIFLNVKCIVNYSV